LSRYYPEGTTPIDEPVLEQINPKGIAASGGHTLEKRKRMRRKEQQTETSTS